MPVRSCVDPPHRGRSARRSVEVAPEAGDGSGFFTLWVCYRECSADYQPVLASDCDDARQIARAGTTVETFCLKVTPGLAPLQGDPRWCAGVQPDGRSRCRRRAGQPGTTPGNCRRGTSRSFSPLRDAARARARQRLARRAAQPPPPAVRVVRRASCDPRRRLLRARWPRSLMSDGRRDGVRELPGAPARLQQCGPADLILCLAQGSTSAASETPADLMHVSSDRLPARAGPAGENAVAPASLSPLCGHAGQPIDGRDQCDPHPVQQTVCPGRAQADDGRCSTTADFKRHNVLVVPEQPLQNHARTCRAR